MKICKTCKLEKPETEFYRQNSPYKKSHSNCKKCENIASVKYRRDRKKIDPVYKERIMAYQRKRDWTKHLKIKYGIDGKQYHQLLENQKGVCAICGQPENRKNNYRLNGLNFTRLSVDHDHITDLVRGLLCYRCNAGLGLFMDDVNLLSKAISYLTKPN